MANITREELRRQQDLIDAKASETGQKEAARYLRSKEEPPTRGNIRAGLAFAALTIITLVIVLAL